MRILVVGAKGMLGSELVREIRTRGVATKDYDPADLVVADLPELDITDAAVVCQAVGDARPDLIVNCAAYTDVDGCETRRDQAFAVNAAGPGHLAEAAEQGGSLLVHVSTDFVFDGERGAPYLEDDPPRPLSVYGKSKLAGERAVRDATDRYLIIRTSWLFGRGGRNFVTAILAKAEQAGRLPVVSDQTGCPTYARDLSRALLDFVGRGLTGTYHLCNAGATTWFGLASEIVSVAGLPAQVDPIPAHDWPRAAQVPAYSVLSCEKARADAGIVLRPWRAALREFILFDLGRAGPPKT